MKNKAVVIICFVFLVVGTQFSIAQEWGGNAYMKGDYVEVAISNSGKEGAAPIPDDSTFHFRSGLASFLWGFVANPQMDGWDEYNGDYFTPGTPECGFGLTYTLFDVEYSKSNNYDVFEIDGEITDYTETVDSVLVTWTGMVDSLQITLLYELRKDELLYTTTVTLLNVGMNTFTDVYYYDNFDPDNNQSLTYNYTTQNTIESQSGMADDSVIVHAVQTDPWTSEVFQLAYGADWKGAIGGFSNRNGAEIWNGVYVDTTEGDTETVDQAIALAHKTDIIGPGKATDTEFSYITAFSREAFSGEVIDDPGASISENESISFRLFPNPSRGGQVNVLLEGEFSYSILDVSGRMILTAVGNDHAQIESQEFEKGVYFVQVTQNGQRGVQRLVLK